MKPLVLLTCVIILALGAGFQSTAQAVHPGWPDPVLPAPRLPDSIQLIDHTVFDQAVQDAIELAEERVEELSHPEEIFHKSPAPLSHDFGHVRRSKADKHAPAGLMGGHVHDQGEWMAEYKYMIMYMEDNRAGSTTLSDIDTIPYTHDGITTNFGASPTQMTSEMHMIHLMYGITDDVSIYTMLNFPVLTMDHIRGPGNPTGGGPGSAFTTHTSGIGDTVFGVLGNVMDTQNDDLIVNFGFSVPTGDIFDTSSNPTAGQLSLPLPYPMRKGSGTFNARPGFTYRHYEECGSYGFQFQTDLPIGENYRDYSVSDVFQINFWYSHLITENIALSVRVENLWKTNYDGADPMTPDALISTNVESFRGGYFLNLGVGAAMLFDKHLLNFELVPTLYQDLEGVQLENDWSAVVSWSSTF